MNRMAPRRRTTTRKSVSGRIMPALNVRNRGDLKEMEKRIRAGPLTLVFVYADWCGHCHTFAPHFDKAVKEASTNRSVQAVKVNDTMLSAVNSYMNKNMERSEEINVEGYPSLILVDTNGKKMSDVEPVPDTERIANVMEKSGNVANTATEMNENVVMPPSPPTNMRNVVNSVAPSPIAFSNQSSPAAASTVATSTTSASAATPNLNQNVTILDNAIPISPPSANLDIADTLSGRAAATNQLGGSLYGSLATAAYELAPAGVLLALASQVSKRRARRSTRGGSNKKGGNRRRTKTMRKKRT